MLFHQAVVRLNNDDNDDNDNNLDHLLGEGNNASMLNHVSEQYSVGRGEVIKIFFVMIFGNFFERGNLHVF